VIGKLDRNNNEVNMLLNRIDELLIVLKSVVEDLHQVSVSLKSMTDTKSSKPSKSPSSDSGSSKTPVKKTGLENLKKHFSKDLMSLIQFNEKDTYTMISPLQFLGSDNFAKIASIVREMNGDYVSAGKISHFRIPKKNDNKT